MGASGQGSAKSTVGCLISGGLIGVLVRVRRDPRGSNQPRHQRRVSAKSVHRDERVIRTIQYEGIYEQFVNRKGPAPRTTTPAGRQKF